MDQLILDKAKAILDEWRQAKLDFIKQENKSNKQHFSSHKNLQEEIVKADKQILDTLEAFVLFREMISSCKFTTGKPRVNKIRGSSSHSWSFQKDRLFIIPTVIAHYGKFGKISIGNITEFNRFNNKNDPIIPYIYVPKEAKVLWSVVCNLTTYWNDKTYINKFIALVHEAFGEKLDELNSQLIGLHDEVGSRLDELVGSRIDKTKVKESNNFQNKLVKFLKGNPKVAEIDPGLIMSCFHIDPNELEAIRKFLYKNRSDLIFITKEDIIQAQNLAKIGQVHDS